MFSKDTREGQSNLAALIAISLGIVASFIVGYAFEWLGWLS
jgi:hypothetical protein